MFHVVIRYWLTFNIVWLFIRFLIKSLHCISLSLIYLFCLINLVWVPQLSLSLYLLKKWKRLSKHQCFIDHRQCFIDCWEEMIPILMKNQHWKYCYASKWNQIPSLHWKHGKMMAVIVLFTCSIKLFTS